jgi:hypothetical protein
MWRIKIKRTEYGIDQDAHNYILYKFGRVNDKSSPKCGEESRQVLGYYTDMHGVSKKLLHLNLISAARQGELDELIKTGIDEVKTKLRSYKHE